MILRREDKDRIVLSSEERVMYAAVARLGSRWVWPAIGFEVAIGALTWREKIAELGRLNP
jgi:hypothetical protein